MHSNIVKCRRVHHFGFAKPNSVLNRVIGQSLVVWAIAEGRRVAQAVEKVLVGELVG
jgi:NADPH-dependent glutamate synthase beta subunit-like oxidoreductase